MKANEIMVGDWVYVTALYGDKCEPFEQQIHGVEYNSFMGSDFCDWVSVDCNDELSLSDIEPIPLTTEILEKNGFEFAGDDIYKFGDYQLVIEYSGGFLIGWVFCCKKQLNYVHELQHTLRLCGLNELADNFKIK